jgi:hypothetical protein
MELFRQPGVAIAFAPAAAWWVAAGAGSVVWAVATPGLWLALAAAGAALVGVAKALQALVVLSRERRVADDWLRSATGSFVPQRYAWRATQLRAACERLRLAKTLRLIERRSVERPRGGYGALRLPAVAENRGSVRLLAERLERIDQPVTPAGMLRVVDLITDGTGPLWNAPRSAELSETISSTLAVLFNDPDEPREHPRAA